jgi:hypothetical protein
LEDEKKETKKRSDEGKIIASCSRRKELELALENRILEISQII